MTSRAMLIKAYFALAIASVYCAWELYSHGLALFLAFLAVIPLLIMANDDLRHY